jgi:hypothetical protein
MRFRRKRDAERPPPAEVYMGLRQQVLSLTPVQLGAELADAPILALLMETGYPEAVATLVAVVDGTSSLYFSNGGGLLGAGEVPRPAPVGVHHVDVAVAAAVAHEADLPAVERPCGMPVPRRVPCQVAQAAALDVDDVDLVVAVAIADKGDPPPVGRPRERAVAVRQARQPALLAPFRVHDLHQRLPPASSERPLVAVTHEGDSPPVR